MIKGLSELVCSPRALREGGRAGKIPALTCLLLLLLVNLAGASSLCAQATPIKLTLEKAESREELELRKLRTPIADGTPWNAPDAVVLQNDQEFIVLEYETPFVPRFLFFQGDNNDVYSVDRSSDGKQWTTLWRVPPRGNGEGLVERRMQLREEDTGAARFLRVRAISGDGRFSVGTFIASDAPLNLPWVAPARVTLRGPFDLAPATIERLKAILAIVALVWVALRSVLSSLVRNAGYWVLLAAALVIWPNGSQYHYQSTVHYWDFYHYYIGGKYAAELEYDRLYECCMQVEIERGQGAEVDARTVRDLRTNLIVPAPDVRSRAAECPSRFSPRRWKEFGDDVMYFKGTMPGGRWAKSQVDHGFNPSPAWTLFGSLIANLSPASEPAVRILCQIDTVILYLMWLAVAFLCGIESAAIGAIFWATNYPARYGWTGGSFLRHDWFVVLMLGLCALKLRRPRIGMVLLTWSAMLRVFPAIIFVGLSFYLTRRLVSGDSAERRAVLSRWIAPSVATAVIMFATSSMMLGGPQIWMRFFENTSKHSATLYTNSMGLRTVLGSPYEFRADIMIEPTAGDPFKDWKAKRREYFEDRVLIFIALVMAGLWAVIRSTRALEPWAVACVSLALVPFAVELSCYYFELLSAFGLLVSIFPGAGAALLLANVAFDQIFILFGDVDYAYVLSSWVTLALCSGILYAAGRARAGEPENEPRQNPSESQF